MPPPSLHCINPDCPAPYPQPPHHKFCQRCGTSLRLQARYVPLERLGAGGFAAIYTVWDELRQVEKVLKVLTIAADKALQLFAQEAVVLRTLRHPGVPRVEPNSFFEICTPDGCKLYCLVMEKIPGQNLEDVLQTTYPQGCPELLVYQWLVQTAAILEVLHRRQIVHRDIKPSNLMLRPGQPSGAPGSGQIVLIDFGGAKQIDAAPSSTRLFSSGYSPPEQLQGGGVEPTADIYALGRTAIHLLTGRHPSELENLTTGRLHWRPGVTVDPEFALLLEAMVEPEAAARPASARRLQQHLGELTGLRQRSQQQAEIHRRQRWRDRLAPWQRRGRQGWQALQRGGTALAVALLETLWSVVLSSTSAIAGLLLGGVLLQVSPWGQGFARSLEGLVRQLSALEISASEAALPFALAGFGVAWGLATASSEPRRPPSVLAGLSGGLGYTIGWLLWENLPYTLPYRAMGLAVTSTAFVLVGLGLPSHYWLHWLTALTGTSGIFWGLWRQGWFTWELLAQAIAFENLGLSLGLGALGAIALGGSLSLSRYLLVPLVRWWPRP